MRFASKRMALCAMVAALCVVLMLLGAVLELGMYACPLLAGLCLIPVGQKYGRKYHILVYVVSGLLCFLFVPNIEENLLFVGLLGWYPIVRPCLHCAMIVTMPEGRFFCDVGYGGPMPGGFLKVEDGHERVLLYL